jgi:acyl carrier protein
MSTITGLYFSSGFLSDLGRQKLMDYSAPGLEALDLTPIPMVGAQSPYSAFTLTHEKGTRVGLAVHAGKGIELWKKNITNLLEETKANIVVDSESYSQQTINIIIKAWSDQLKIDPNLCHSNYETSFSDLGGDSLSLVQLFTEVQDRLSSDDNSPIAMEIFSYGTSITIKQMAHLYSKYS